MEFKLNKILKEKCMTQAELALAVGLSRNAVNTLANNPRQIRLETLGALCKALDKEPNDLFEYTHVQKEA